MLVGWEDLQQMVESEMSKVYSKTVIDHALNPRNAGVMDDYSGYATVTGPCGDTMEIWLRIKNGVIAEANFMTDGCGTTIAAGSMVTEMVKCMPLNQALQISQQYILDALEGLPEESRHCALLAANTLREAVKDYYEYGRESWKRAYRNRMNTWKTDEIRE